MRTTLTSRENGVIDTFLEVRSIREILAEEDQPCTRTTKCLVRGGSDNITIFEGVVQLLSCYQPTGMRNVRHKPGAFPLCYLLQCTVVPIPRVRGCTTDNKTRFEDFSLGVEPSVVDEVRGRCSGVGEGLEVDGRGSHFLFGSIVAVCKMTTVRKTKTHQTVLRLEERGKRRKVCRL